MPPRHLSEQADTPPDGTPSGYPPPGYPPPAQPPVGYPPPGYPPTGQQPYPQGYPPPGYPPQGYPPQGYPPQGYPPQGYPPPGYPPPGYPPGGQGPGTRPRQHGWHTPNGRQPPTGGAPPPQRARTQRSVIWLIVVVAVVVILIRAHRISSTDIILFCILIPSVILHEVSHGFVALAFGDDTAKRAGRLSLNPLRHVTIIGTIIVPAITIWAGWGFFGWAKPVPVNVGRLRSPRNHGLLVALAGPLTNVVLAAIFGLVFYLAFALGRVGPVPTSLGARIIFDAGVINLWVACFNMFPVPPLDGSALLERLLPARWWPGYLRFRPYGLFVILGAIVLLSWVGVYPLEAVFSHIAPWWARIVHAT